MEAYGHAPIFCTAKPFFVLLQLCVYVSPTPMDVAFVTLPHKHAFKGMKLVMINHDTVEGEKR